MSAYAYESILLAVRSGRPATEAARRAAVHARHHPRRLTRTARVGQLLLGVILVGIGVALMIRAGLGVASWDVLHVGLSRVTGWSIGTAAWVVGAGALALGTLLGQRPRRGTVVPLLVVGPVIDLTTRLVDQPVSDGGAWALLFGGVIVLATGVGAYLTADHGVGPSDMIFMAMSERGLPVWAARLAIDGLAVFGGFLLGGPIGLGTIAITLAIGPLTQVAMRAFDLRPAIDAAGCR